MEISRYVKLLNSISTSQNAGISDLKAILKKYPYFQSARVLYLKALKDQDSFRYNYELKQTAAYTVDRTVLFDFITSHEFDKKETIHTKINQRIESESIEKVTEENTSPVSEIEEELTIGKPISFSKTETHSFVEWLQLSTQKPINRNSLKEIKKKSKGVDKFQLIDTFLKSSPKISPIEKSLNTEIEIPKLKNNNSLMTQTLAKVYLEQKKYEKAIKAYEILSLKYPEKSGFFADQIRKIKILQKNKL